MPFGSRVSTALALAVLLFPLSLVVVASTDAAPLSVEGWWGVHTLLPGRSAIPPSHAVVAGSHAVRLLELKQDRVSRFATYVGEKLHFVNVNVPEGETNVCRFPSHIRAVNLTGAFEEDEHSLRVDCNEALLDGLTERSLSVGSATYFKQYAPPQALWARHGSASGSSCQRLPWRIETISVHRPSGNRLLVSAHLLSEAGEGEEESPEPCLALFDLTRSTEQEEKNWRSYVGPILMIVIVLAVRTLPRYYLQRTGSIDVDTFRSHKPLRLTPEKRAELLRKQHEIITQMKREDGLLTDS